MESIIGKKYRPNDNSYSICISDKISYGNFSRHYLAGTDEGFGEQELPVIECTIISDPFKVNITNNVVNRKGTSYFILVNDPEEKTHMVLFFVNCIVK